MEYKAESRNLPKPYFDRASSTRTLCIIGLSLSWMVALLSLAVGVPSSVRSREVVFSTPISFELVILGQNILITVCNESLGFIHSVSLRWALQREGRLAFNSNLRLFTSSRTSKPNKWYSNVVVLCGIVVTYASSSLTFLLINKRNSSDGFVFRICGQAFVTLGCGVAAQASIATWSLARSNPPTWSSVFLDTAAVSFSADPGLEHRPGRSLQGVHSSASPAGQAYAQRRQPSAYSAHKELRHVLWLTWLCVILSSTWSAALLIAFVSKAKNSMAAACWTLLPGSGCTPALNLPWEDALAQKNLPIGDFCWTFLLICAIQVALTLTLHCTELQVSCSRDETLWRKAASKKGFNRDTNAFTLMLTSWQSISLFFFKAVLHWLYGLSMVVYIRNGPITGLSFYAPQTCSLTAGIALLGIFSTTIMFWRHKGPQPVTFGHLQTLVDLIDYWPPDRDGDRMYWGDKGDEAGVAHAGTSWMPLASIRFDTRYA